MCNIVCPRVVGKDRKAGVALYAVVVAGFVAASTIVVLTSVQKRAAPPTQLDVSKKPFRWPHISMCAETASVTFVDADIHCDVSEGGGSEEELIAEYEVLAEECSGAECTGGGKCITFFTGRFVAKDKWAGINIWLPFNPVFADPEDGLEYAGRSQLMEVYLHTVDSLWEADVDLTSTYSPFPADVQMVVVPTVRIKLDGSETYDYSITSTAAPLVGYDGNSTVGESLLRVFLAPNGGIVTTVTEQDPLDPLLIVGVVSGLWGVFSGVFYMLFRSTEKETLVGVWRAAAMPPGSLRKASAEPYRVAPAKSPGSDVEMLAASRGAGAGSWGGPSSGPSSPRAE